MERLQEMIRELVNRVTSQEQVQVQLREELGSKLDRLELGPFRQELEEHWKGILAKLKEKVPREEADDAAGLRKQLLAPFQCLSCDRSLKVQTPGPHITTLPAIPPLTPRLPRTPHTVIKLEQTQQPGHREQAVEGRFPIVPRQCGGQHTITSRFQPRPPNTRPPLKPLLGFPNEHDVIPLLGRDGRIYRGRRDRQLPSQPQSAESSPRLLGPAMPPLHRPDPASQ
ncbi:glutamine-rich protein 2-like [Nyctibius grandis]|uniref:glutamine-rich protein 2-like n=1 Tax=Nyctibius grandis TaxID=48427 RepID=UPI0035BC3C1D